jgi:filamentous hemagglutinin
MADLTGGGNVLVDAGTTILARGTVAADLDVALRARAGSVTAQNIAAGDDLVIRAETDVTTGALASGDRERTTMMNRPNGVGDVLARTIAGFAAADLTGGGDVLADSRTGNIAVGGSITSDYDTALRAALDLAVTGPVNAGDDIVLVAGRDISTGALTAGAIERTSAGNRPNAVGDVLAGIGTVDLTGGGYVVASAGDDFSAGAPIIADLDVALRATNSIATTDINAGDDIVLRAGTGVATGALTAGARERDGLTPLTALATFWREESQSSRWRI